MQVFCAGGFRVNSFCANSFWARPKQSTSASELTTSFAGTVSLFRKKLAIVNEKDGSSVLFATIVAIRNSALLAVALFSVFSGSFLFSQTAYGASITLSVDNNITANVVPKQDGNTIATSDTDTANISINTTNITGYTLSLKSNSDTPPALTGAGGSIPSISQSAPTLNDLGTNTWGYKPTKWNGNNWEPLAVKRGNETPFTAGHYLPGPTTSEDIIDITNAANTTNNQYNLAVATNINNTIPVGSYSNDTFIVTAVTNPVPEDKWYKYNVDPIMAYGENKSSGTSEWSVSRSNARKYYYGTSYTFDPATGQYTVNQSTNPGDSASCANIGSAKYYYISTSTSSGTKSGTTMYQLDSGTQSGGMFSGYDCDFQRYTYTNTQYETGNYKKGSTYIDTITAPVGTYPDNGTPDNTYWYVKAIKVKYVVGADGTGGPTDGYLSKDGTIEYTEGDPTSTNPDKPNFFGWATTSGATSAEYKAGDVVTVPAGQTEITLYAVFGNVLYMQDVTAWGSSVALNDSVQAVDKRDNKMYWVTRICQVKENGNCTNSQLWMTQNLDYDLSIDANKSLKADTSDVLADRTLTITSGWGTNNTALYYYNAGDYYIAGGNTKTKTAAPDLTSADAEGNTNLHYHLGSYYSWNAATANTSTSNTQYANAPGSICPKGWHLPRDYDGSSTRTKTGFSYLLYTNGIISSATSTSWASGGFANINKAPLYFANTDTYYNGNKLTDLGSYGVYWSSTVGSSSYAYYLGFYSSYVNPAYDLDRSYRYLGDSVRCVSTQ